MRNSTKVATTSSRMRGHDSRSDKVRSHRVRSSTNERDSSSTPSTLPDLSDEPDTEELRRARTKYYNERPEERRTDAHKKMASDYSRGRESGPMVSTLSDSNKTVREVREGRGSEHRRRRRRPQDPAGDGNESIVYVYKSMGDSTDKRDLPREPRLRRASDTVTRSRADVERERRDDIDTIRVSTRSKRPEYPERPKVPLRTDERPLSRTVSKRTRSYYPDRERTTSRTGERPASRTGTRSRAGAIVNR